MNQPDAGAFFRLPALIETTKTISPATIERLEFSFGATAAGLQASSAGTTLALPLPRLSGDISENIFSPVRPLTTCEGWSLWENDDVLVGCRTAAVRGPIAETTESIYTSLLRASSGRSLYRIWNYVPAINAHVGGEENYRAFCAGRAQAFESAFGPSFSAMLPAASAVGCTGDSLCAIFVAGRLPGRRLENVEQIPAYLYPPEHGRRSPSFSRAMAVPDAARPLVFVSGTAAIKGHETVAPGDLSAQLDCTLDNLRLISRASGLGDNFSPPGGAAVERHFKIYLRHRGDLAAARARLGQTLLRAGDHFIYLHSDICRSELLVEIEATIIGGRG